MLSRRSTQKLASLTRPIRSWNQPILHPRCSISKLAQRKYSSIPPPSTETPPAKPADLRSQFNSSSSSQPPPPPPKYTTQPTRKRSLRPLIYATLFLFIGMSAGQYVRLVMSPPPLPPADSPQDVLMVEHLHKRGAKLPLVKALMEDPAWEWHDAYTSIPLEEKSARLTTGPLAGARGLGGFQRIFSNKETGELIAVTWFGGAMAGWPGVTHGGLVATVMDEQLGRCAVRQFPSQTGVTANLDINFRKPVLTNDYYVVRAWPQKETFTERKGWVSGQLETLDGMICAEAKALFVVPKKYQTKIITGNF